MKPGILKSHCCQKWKANITFHEQKTDIKVWKVETKHLSILGDGGAAWLSSPGRVCWEGCGQAHRGHDMEPAWG